MRLRIVLQCDYRWVRGGEILIEFRVEVDGLEDEVAQYVCEMTQL